MQPAPVYVASQPQPPPAEYVAPAPPPPVYVPAPVVQPEVVVEIHDETDFYEPLQAYGSWIDVPGYGRCWTPTGIDPDWRPYADGHWQRTDAGWYWVSDERWGWATYHYGRWHRDDTFGWVWVPQTQWAPAWVAWREGGGYTGWAPLPPEARIGDNGANQNGNPDPRAFVFVEKKRMLDPQRHQNLIVNNTTIINNTINIDKVVVVNKVVINEGPPPESVAQATGRQVEVVSARNLRSRQEAPAFAASHSRSPVQSRTTTPNSPPLGTYHPATSPAPSPAVRQPPVSMPTQARPPVPYHPVTAPNQAPLVRSAPAPAPVQVRPPTAASSPNQPEKPQPLNPHPTIKPAQVPLTPQQKLELEKKKAEEKRRVEDEKPHSGSSTNAPPPR
jgi:hypothetical protein